MTFAVVAALSAAMAIAARPPPVETRPTATRFDSALAAVRVALQSDPVVVAFGEWHQTRATAGVPSALRRFTADILPALAERFSHLIVETWVTTGRCGAAERAVIDDVQKTTERPAETENEIETLLRTAAAGGIAPRILSIACTDYVAMRSSGHPGDQHVDYDQTLRITTRALEAATLAALRERRAVRPRPFVAIYGGALHNDLHPAPGLEGYSFASSLLAAVLGRVLEIDLVVPEYAAGSAAMRAQSWWSAYTRARRPGATVLVRRSPRSFVIVFPPVSGAHPSTR